MDTKPPQSTPKNPGPIADAPSFRTPGYEDLELSTQILIGEALRRGAEVEVLDRRESFIALTLNGHTEYIKQATRTSLDTYIAALIMENKLVTKHVLRRAGIAVPGGRTYVDPKTAIDEHRYFAGRDIVVKPNNTNFGLAVAVLSGTRSEEAYAQAVHAAFAQDGTILVEEFIPGREYRFLVLDDQVNAILERVPANVEGNGRHTIAELVREKNRDPLRGTGYVTPLEKIGCTAVEEDFLARQGKSFTSVPLAGERVYLRKNSNISTGGDSIDRTDDIHPAYKELAVEATRAAGAVISGADIVIEDIGVPPSPGNHAVIELNFNPAIHIHCFPYRGKNRHPERVILDLLGVR